MPITPRVINQLPYVGLIPIRRPAQSNHFLQQQGTILTELDDALQPVASRDVGVGTVFAARDLDRIAIANDGVLRITGDALIEVPDFACDGGLFLCDYLIASAPDRWNERVILVGLDSGQVLDVIEVPAAQTAGYFRPHPHELAVTAEFPMGQDGTVFYTLQIQDDRLNAHHMRTWFGGTWLDPVSSGFNSTGTRLLLSPYPNDADTLRLVDWPGLHEISSLSRDQFTNDGGIGESACWLDDDRILTYLVRGGLVMTDATLGNPQPVALPDGFDEIEIALLQPIRPGRVAVTIHNFKTTILVLDF